MTVPAGQTPIITYAYAGEGNYDFSFRVFEDEDLKLTHLDANGVRTLLVAGELNDYTVTLLDDGDNGGTCHVLSTLVGGSLEIRRALLQEQPTNWVNNNPFNAELLETDLDRALMIIQEMQVVIDGAYVATNWRAGWIPAQPYHVRDMVVNEATGNIYTALTDHISGVDFDDDLADGNWLILIDVEAVEIARLDAEESAAEALVSANSATTSEANVTASEEQAAISEANSVIAAQDAANCRQGAYEYGLLSQLESWEAEAAKMNAESYATEAEDVPVKVWSSDGDGTFSSVDTSPIEYSALHWKEKASAIAGGGVQNLFVTAPITKGGTTTDPIVGFSGDKTDVGLANVDNTSDADKPVSTLTQTEIDTKEDDLSNPTVEGQVLSSTIAGVRSWSSYGIGIGYAMTGLSAKTLDAALYDIFELNAIDTNFTVTVSNLTAGRTITIFLDSANPNTVTWPTGWYWVDGVLPTLSANIDVVVVTQLSSGKIVASIAAEHSVPV